MHKQHGLRILYCRSTRHLPFAGAKNPLQRGVAVFDRAPAKDGPVLPRT